MNEQAEQDWWETDMSETQQREIKARLMAACDTKAVNADAVVLGYRQRLERGSAVHYPR